MSEYPYAKIGCFGGQRLCLRATVDAGGGPRVVPVAFWPNGRSVG